MSPTIGELRALTIRWPWVAPIVYPAPRGCVPKQTENRTRRTSYYGPVAIHAGKAWDRPALRDVVMADWITANGLDGIDLAYCAGRILAVADLTGCHPSDGACCLPWGESRTGVWHWELANVRRLNEPVACRGQLGLWRVPEPAAEQVLAQIGAAA